MKTGAPVLPFSFSDLDARQSGDVRANVGSWQIVLQKSKVAGLRIFAKYPQREAIADSSYLNRATEVAYEFNVPR